MWSLASSCYGWQTLCCGLLRTGPCFGIYRKIKSIGFGYEIICLPQAFAVACLPNSRPAHIEAHRTRRINQASCQSSHISRRCCSWTLDELTASCDAVRARRVSITKLTEIATYCCMWLNQGVGDGESGAAVPFGGRHVRLCGQQRTTTSCKKNQLWPKTYLTTANGNKVCIRIVVPMPQ